MTRSSPATLVLACVMLGAAPAMSAAPGIPPSAEKAYTVLASRVKGDTAMDVVRFMDQYWRIAGNPGFNASIDHIRERLTQAGVESRVDEFPNGRRGWDYQVGTVSFVDTGEVLISRERDRVALCINSFSTSEGGVDALVVDVGAGANPSDYDGKDIKGSIVLGTAEAGRLWQQAVKARGAIGVISTSIAPYIRPSDPTKFTSPDQQEVFQWGSVPYDATARAFGFKASWRAGARVRERLKSGPARLKVDVQSTFYDGPNRSLIVEIPGSSRSAERIVMVAHVQEPGANDDGSGCGTLMALVVALHRAIESGALPAPGRTLTFIWADEVVGSRQWITSNPDRAANVQYMFAMDMTGEDVSKTGGSFLIEKQPDPSAVWPRPSDPHTAWGASEVKAASLKGSLLNDLHLAVCLRHARDTGWVVRTNPYEGGSDHTAFGDAGIPSLLNWHFTDRYYHTNLDRPDKTSAAEMVNVGVAVATSAWFLASADEADALATVDIIAAAARSRLDLEATQSATPEILAAWHKWYREALETVRRLSVDGPSSKVDAAVAAAQGTLP
jgi:aminopeptidase YwaD